ncbi:hypothetical protein [Dokdonia sp.]|uniref:hypothetical protein n=1 Tax=Dokdonia sp. TaxID=2024995 RepID=UPI0032633ECE
MEKTSSEADIALRNPALINNKNNQNLIYSPDNTTSHFVKIAQIVDRKKRAAAITKAARTYNVFESSTEVRSALPSLYDFATWLAKHKNDLSFSNIRRNIHRATVLTEAQELFVWENLIYQVIEKKSDSVKKTLIELLVANDFLKAFIDFSKRQTHYPNTIVFTTDLQKEFTGRAHATVIITNELPVKIIPPSFPVPTIKEQRQQLVSTEHQLLQNKVQLYHDAHTELKEILLLRDQEIETNFDTAITQYQKDVNVLIKESSEISETMIDAMTNEIITKAFAVEPFSFKPQKPVLINTILNHVTEVSKGIIERDILCVCTTLPEALVFLKRCIRNMRKTISVLENLTSFKTSKKEEQKKEEETTIAIDYNFVRLQPSLQENKEQEKRSITMIVSNDIEKTDIASMSYTITFNNEVSSSGTTYQIMGDRQTIVSLFPDEIKFPSNAIYYDITGNIVTTDGREVTFDKRVSLSHDCNYGDFGISSNTTI